MAGVGPGRPTKGAHLPDPGAPLRPVRGVGGETTEVLVALLAAVVGLGVGLLTGGRWPDWRAAGVRQTRWLLGALALQLASLAIALGSPGAPRAVHAALLVASLAVAVAFALRNRALPGMPLVAAGAAANALVIALNGAMPDSLRAAARAGIPPEALALDADPRHVLLDPGTALPWLGDVVPLPLPLAPEVVSPGDLVLGLGLALAVAAAARRTAHEREGRAHALGSGASPGLWDTGGRSDERTGGT